METMCLKLLIYHSLFIVLVHPVRGHIPSYVTTPTNRIEQYCALSDTCTHDTIPICGKNGDEKRSFLDLCDLLEYGCDTGELFVHIDDIPGCPIKRKQ